MQVLLRQQELLQQWEGVLHHVLHPDEPDEPDDADAAARGGAAGPHAQQLVATQYNGLLRLSLTLTLTLTLTLARPAAPAVGRVRGAAL